MNFPILSWKKFPGCPPSIPWALVRDCDDQARRNHNQSLNTLAGRGGLDPCELYAIMHGGSLRTAALVPAEEAVKYINARIKAFEQEQAKDIT